MGIFGGAVLWPTTGPTSPLFSVAPSTHGLRYSFFSLSPVDDRQGFHLYFSKLFPLRTRTVRGTQKVPIKCMWNEWLRAEQGLGLRAPDPSRHPVESFPKAPGYKVPSLSEFSPLFMACFSHGHTQASSCSAGAPQMGRPKEEAQLMGHSEILSLT